MSKMRILRQLARSFSTGPNHSHTHSSKPNPAPLSMHDFHHTSLLYFREVLACAINPALIADSSLNIDARTRAERILGDIISVGSYSESRGIGFVRASACRFIAKMDGVAAPSMDEVILTEGAQRAYSLVIQTLISDGRDAVLIPAPNYPLHAQVVRLSGGIVGQYRLNHHNNWGIETEELERVHAQLVSEGKKPKAIVIVNPGNPTGSTQSPQTLAKVLEFAVTHGLLVIADEVFRDNIESGGCFQSCRRVLEGLSADMRERCEVASIHSISKGLTMAAGLRGGYLYVHNLSPLVLQQLHKLQTLYGCSNVVGQLMLELALNPFQGMSASTRTRFLADYHALKASVKDRRKLVVLGLGAMERVKCQQGAGGMYLYPQVSFSRGAVRAAEAAGVGVEALYCQRIQQATGTALVPGSSFAQPAGRHHFRISPCLFSQAEWPIRLQKLKTANQQFHRNYAH